VHRLEQHAQHLLAIVLGEALELDSLASHPLLDIPRGDGVLLTKPDFLNELGECLSQAAACAQSILPVQMLPINFVEEELDQRLRIRQALQD